MNFATDKRRWPAILLALFVAMGMHQATFAQVLCIGEDGHVEVELATDDCCGDNAIPASGDRSAHVDCEDADCADHCGACLDVPIGTNGRIATQSGSMDRSETPAVCLVLAHPTVRDSSVPAYFTNRGTAYHAAPPSNVSAPLIR